MFNEANEPSSACRLWRVSQVETSTPPRVGTGSIDRDSGLVKECVRNASGILRSPGLMGV